MEKPTFSYTSKIVVLLSEITFLRTIFSNFHLSLRKDYMKAVPSELPSPQILHQHKNPHQN